MAGSPEHIRGATSRAYPLLEQWALEVRRTMANANRDQVHDLRVASRRFAQMIAVLDGVAGTGVGKIRRRLKETIQLAGAVRDFDITANLVGKFNAPARLQSRLRKRRAEAARELTDGLRLLQDRGIAQKWRARLPRQNGAVSAAERQVLSDAAESLFSRAAKLDEGPQALHKLRIAAKKLRYTMELLHFPAARLEPIKELQSRLGDINDYESARRLVRKEGASKKLLSHLEEAQQKKTNQFRRYWKREFAGKERGWTALLARISPASAKPRISAAFLGHDSPAEPGKRAVTEGSGPRFPAARREKKPLSAGLPS